MAQHRNTTKLGICQKHPFVTIIRPHLRWGCIYYTQRYKVKKSSSMYEFLEDFRIFGKMRFLAMLKICDFLKFEISSKHMPGAMKHKQAQHHMGGRHATHDGYVHFFFYTSKTRTL